MISVKLQNNTPEGSLFVVWQVWQCYIKLTANVVLKTKYWYVYCIFLWKVLIPNICSEYTRMQQPRVMASSDSNIFLISYFNLRTNLILYPIPPNNIRYNNESYHSTFLQLLCIWHMLIDPGYKYAYCLLS